MQGQSFVLSILYLPLKFKSFYFTTVQKLFSEKFSWKWKSSSCEAQFGYLQIKYVKDSSERLKVLEFHGKLQKPSKTL